MITGPFCQMPDCGRKVWFTREQLCRDHGLATGCDQDIPTVPSSPSAPEPDTTAEPGDDDE